MAARKKAVNSGGMSLAELIDAAITEDPIIPGEPTGWISTGSDLLDWSMGGGLPCGRMVEMYGRQSSGKSLIAAHSCRNVLRAGGTVVYLDCEAAVDLAWWRRLRVDPSCPQVILRTPTYLEEVHDIIERVVERMSDVQTPTLIVWDSLAAVAAKASFEKKSAEDSVAMGLEARLNSDFFRRAVLKTMRNSHCSLLVINQVRASLARFAMSEDSQETTPGGQATGYYASLRLKTKKTGYIRTQTDPPHGIYMNVTVTKSRLGPPGRSVDLTAFFQYGLDNHLSLIRFLEDYKGIEKTANGRVVWDGKTMLRNDLRSLMSTDVKVLEAVQETARETFRKIHNDI